MSEQEVPKVPQLGTLGIKGSPTAASTVTSSLFLWRYLDRKHLYYFISAALALSLSAFLYRKRKTFMALFERFKRSTSKAD
jgi:hypothetical protein